VSYAVPVLEHSCRVHAGPSSELYPVLAVVMKIPYIICTEYRVPGIGYQVLGTMYRNRFFPPGTGTGTGPVFFLPLGILRQIGRCQYIIFIYFPVQLGSIPYLINFTRDRKI
jgi:hypothetical protein